MLSIFDNFIFDVDGTIINSSQEVLLCLQKAFQENNYNIDISRFTSDVIGPPLEIIIKNLSPEIEDETVISNIIKSFRRIYDYNEDDISILYPKIYDVLITLKQKNKRLFIATFKPSIPTLRLVKKFNLSMFEDVYTIDKFDEKMTKKEMISDIITRYNLDKNKTVMIGDAISDMQAATSNNIKAAAVSWGYEQNQNKLKEISDFFIETAEDIL